MPGSGILEHLLWRAKLVMMLAWVAVLAAIVVVAQVDSAALSAPSRDVASAARPAALMVRGKQVHVSEELRRRHDLALRVMIPAIVVFFVAGMGVRSIESRQGGPRGPKSPLGGHR
jgi:hypothetical protein